MNGGRAAKGQRPKTLKRRNAPKTARHSGSLATGKETNVARLTRERDEALEQQTATSEVLRVISSSPGELEPVFNAILENATRICEAKFGVLFRYENGAFRAAAMLNAPQALAEFHRQLGSFKPPAGTPLDRLLKTGDAIYTADEAAESNPGAPARFGGARSLVTVPMRKENKLIGAIIIYRQEVRPFTDKQIELLTNFAAQAVIAIENTRLLGELRESLQQQTATADVLKVISSSPGELEPVFQAILENATRICQAGFGTLNLYDGDAFHNVALHNPPPQYAMRRGQVIHPHPESALAYVARTKQIAHIDDLRTRQSYLEGHEAVVGLVDLAGARTLLVVPMLKEGELVGSISIYRQEVRPFTDKQIELVSNFAAQAVIAIENTRLLSELRESLQRQMATSEVLEVISSSPGELEPVFNAMLENATRICEAKLGTLFLLEGDSFRCVAVHGDSYYADLSRREPVVDMHDTIHKGTPLERLTRTKAILHIPDLRADEGYLGGNPRVKALVESAGARTHLVVPMLKDDELVGAIVIYRQEVRPFSDKQVELLTNFAAQAVIAIENTRLLNELRESLQQQTATAEVLKVISSSPGELEPVFEAMLENATRICEAKFGTLFGFDGKAFRRAAGIGAPPALDEFQKQLGPFLPESGSLLDRALQTRQVAHSADYAAESITAPPVKLGGARSTVAVPMLKDDKLVGAIVIYRQEVRPFTDKQIELVKNFATQAVIAIENVRLLNELRESLQQQTATADVLKVISSSPGELEPVFEAMLENATRICGAKFGNLFLREADGYRAAAVHGEPTFIEHWRRAPFASLRDTPLLDRVTRTKQVLHIPDLRLDQYYLDGNPRIVTLVDSAGARTFVSVPMLKDDEIVGTIAMYRQEVQPFTDKQIELVENFAAQAVIAIENTRLLSELRQSLQQQTATADVLKAISRSAFDLKTVLDALVEAAARLCEADQGTIARERGGVYLRVATYGFPDDFTEYVRTLPVVAERGTGTGRALLEGKVVHIPDVQADPEYTFVEGQKLGGFRTILSVPMLREGTPIGVLTLTRHEMRPFTDKQIELVSTFADQAAIAIENVRLFESVEARTRELAASLQDLRSAQDRLVQTEKLASLGQLTAGIAHEIKNPLNFVNNFSAISVELIDELREALAGANLDNKLRAQIGEIADMLQGNLDKVVQHGKRADAIVKNMLLHSRQGSQEHRSVDINAIVEESLNLAYHGARAEKQGFNITLERSLDPTAGEVDVFPQEITRVLLNLISNGFYAATKRKAEANGRDYEPTLAAATKNLGDSVEIRIRDNGTGIPPEVKDKMFNPFFTTKPVGEGTGLGLSISHDIIVKQHGGSIEVDTQPGEFTEFRIVLPRGAATIAKSGERA